MNSSLILRSLLLAALAFCTAPLRAAATPPQWPQFHGPAASGIAADDRPAPVEFGLTKQLLWQTPVPPGHSSPCVWGDRIFLTAHAKATRTLATLCLDRATGKILWQREVTPEKLEKVHRTSSPAVATPATDGKSVFVYFGSYGLVAYDFDGGVRWERKLPMPVIFLDFGSGTSPIVAGDRVIVDLQLGGESHVLAVRAADGETAWKAEKPSARGWASPVWWREGDDECVGVFNTGRFTAYDLKDGRERWFLSGLPNQVCATPIVTDGLIFLNGTGVYGESSDIIPPPPFAEALAKYDANSDGLISVEELPKTLLYVDRKNSAASGNQRLRDLLFRGKQAGSSMNKVEWEEAVSRLQSFASGSMMTSALLAVRPGGKGEVKESHVAWTQSKGVPEVPSALCYRDRLYTVKNGGVLTCRNPKSGKTLYEERVEAAGGYFASPIAAGGNVYLASDRGVITVCEAGDKFKVTGRADLQEPIISTPAILEAKLYVRTEKQVLAFGK
jgi:outer membrane protein assembly factor BamB